MDASLLPVNSNNINSSSGGNFETKGSLLRRVSLPFDIDQSVINIDDQTLLIKQISNFPRVMVVLKMFGFVDCHGSGNILEFFVFHCRYILSRLTLFCVPAASIIRIYIFTSLDISQVEFYVDVFCMLGLFMQSVVLIPSLVFLKRRLSTVADIRTALLYDNNVQYCLIFFVFSIITSMLFPIFILLTSSATHYVVYSFGWLMLFGQMAVCVYLTINLLFFKVDSQFACLLLDELLNEMTQKTITLQRFTTVRKIIADNVSNTLYLNSSMVVINMLNGSILLVLIWKGSNYSLYNDICFFFLFVKEALFLIIMALDVTRINEKADLLTSQLSDSLTDHNEDGRNNVNMITCISALQRPIGYTLVGARLNYKQFVLYMFGLTVAVLLGLFRTILVSTL